MKLKLVIAAMAGIAVACPIAALAFVKPLRIAVPSFVPGIQCPDQIICTDNPAELDNARRLYEQGITAAAAAVGPFETRPRVVFCSTDACAASFGLGRRAAEAVGDIGLVVAPRGWKSFYLTHELIHVRQAEALGNIAVATKPRWLIEGMAYSLSNDPRHPLGEPFEQWRSQFQAWHADLGKRDMWTVARSVR